MSRRSQNRNQYESTTTGDLAIGAFTVSVVSTLGLITDQNMYLVIEPDVDTQREWILIESITGNQLNIQNPNGRNLTGSDGDLLHPAGSKVRSVPTQQIFEDIFQDAEDDELNLTLHQTDGGDPHAQAGYLNQADGDQLYVNLVGDTMTGLLILSADPTVAFGAATKQYVDGFLPLSGGTMTGALILDGAPTVDLQAATKAYADLFLPLTGGQLSGTLDMTGNQIVNIAELLTNIGSATEPSHSFGGSTNAGMYRAAADVIGFSVLGVNIMTLGATAIKGNGVLGTPLIRSQVTGTALSPTYSFDGDVNTGMYRFDTDVIAFSTSGSDVLRLHAATETTARFVMQLGTTGFTANLFQAASLATPGVQLSTSARKYKSNIVTDPTLADLDLAPVRFYRSDDDKDFIGFIADDMPDDDMILFDSKDEVENYDLRAVVAVLAAKVNRLESL